MVSIRKPSTPEVADPRLVDVDHALDDRGMLGEEVVEAEEIAVERVLAHERRVAAVVVERDVVEPARDLELLLVLLQDGRVREARLGVERGERARSCEVAIVERVAIGVAIGLLVLGDVGLTRALLVADHVGRVVGDDVEVDLHAALVRRVDQGLEVVVAAQVRIDLREVGDPVAVVAGALVLRLHRLVLEARGQPDESVPSPWM